MEDTDWDRYGTGNYEKCANCMAHCGYEATAVMDTLAHPAKALVKAVRGVARGEQGWVSKRVADRIGSWENVSGNDRVTLTNQELKVLGFIAEKKTDRDIAQGLNLSIEEAARVVKVLRDKFNAHSRVELAVRAHKDGFI